jgi:hypothetical protein
MFCFQYFLFVKIFSQELGQLFYMFFGKSEITSGNKQKKEIKNLKMITRNEIIKRCVLVAISSKLTIFLVIFSHRFELVLLITVIKG